MLEHAEHQRQGGHGLLPAGKQRQAAQLFSGRACQNVYAGFEDVVGICQDDIGAASAEELSEQFLEVHPDAFEGFHELIAAFLVDPPDELVELLAGILDVAQLCGKKFTALFELLLLADGVEVDIAEPLDLPAQFVDFPLDRVPVALLVVLVGREALQQVHVHFVAGAGDEVLHVGVGLGDLHTPGADLFGDLIVAAARLGELLADLLKPLGQGRPGLFHSFGLSGQRLSLPRELLAVGLGGLDGIGRTLHTLAVQLDFTA